MGHTKHRFMPLMSVWVYLATMKLASIPAMPNSIVICTSTNPQDDPLEEPAEREDVRCFRGHEEDVIRRLHEATESFGFDYVLNITADCPFGYQLRPRPVFSPLSNAHSSSPSRPTTTRSSKPPEPASQPTRTHRDYRHNAGSVRVLELAA